MADEWSDFAAPVTVAEPPVATAVKVPVSTGWDNYAIPTPVGHAGTHLNPETQDYIPNFDQYGLEPDFNSNVKKWAIDVRNELGLEPVITEGYRSPQRSDELKRRGIIALPGGQSYHNYGQAFDYGFKTPNGIDLKNEKAYAAAERISHRYGITGISNESGHLQNSGFSVAGAKSYAPKVTGEAPAGESWGDYANPVTSGTKPESGWKSGIGSEFGEVDNPAYGGYTEPNWNRGSGGANLAGWNTDGVALPDVPLGTRVEVRNDATGATTIETVKDHGPGQGTGANIDLLGGVISKLGLPHNYKGPISYRVVGGTQAPSEEDWSKYATSVVPRAELAHRNVETALPAGAEAESYGASAATTPAPAPDLNAPPPGYSQTQIPVERATPVDTTKMLPALPLNVRRAQPVDVQTVLPVGADQEDYSTTGSMIRPTPLGSEPHEANDPFELQIKETQVNPDLTDSQKAWMIQSLRAQQAKSEPHVERALPVNQEVPGMYDKYTEGYDLSSGLSGPGPKVERAFPVEQPGQAPKPTSIHGLGGFIDQTWKDLASTWSNWHAGAKQEQGLAPEVNDPYEQAIRELQTNPDMTEAQKQDATLKIRSQQMAARTANIAETIPATSEAKRVAAKIDQEYAKTFPGRLASGVAGGLAYVPSLAAGPMAPFLAATQATAGAFREQLDQGIARSHDTHPEWTDEQRLMAALSAATEGAKGAGESALVLGFINVPVAGPLISRIVQKIGIGAGSMEIANVLATVQRNMALKRTIDPSQDILEGLRDLNGHLENLIAGGVYAVPHAAGEIGRGRVPATPQEPIESRPAVVPPELSKTPPEAQPGTPTEQPRAAVVEENGKATTASTENAVPAAVRQVETQPEPSAPVPEKPLLDVQPQEETEHWVSAIANRYAQERSASGEIGEIAPGQGYSRTDLRERGLQMSPEEINQHVSDLMHDTGDAKLQAAAITAEEARLSQRSSQLSHVAESNPGQPQAQMDAENAFKDLTDFHNGPVAKLKNNWHAQGMTLQGEVPVDLSTFNGLREAWLKDVGKPTTPDVEANMRRTARQVRDAVGAENGAMDNLGKRIEETTRTQKMLSADEVRNNILVRMGVDPCL